MSAKPRCHDCEHRRGERSTAPLAMTAPFGKPNRAPVQPVRARKAPCSCACHDVALARVRREEAVVA